MRLPKTIQVFGRDYKIALTKHLKDEDGNRVDGLFCAKTSVISIDTEDKNQVHTLIHELGHAVFERTSLNQTDISSNLQEIVVNSIATVLTENFNISLRKDK